MKSEIKLWKKQEKRIVKLLYKKGFLKDFKIEDFYWESFKYLNRRRYKSKDRLRHFQFLPELHFGTVDCWGEGDDHSIVDTIHQELYWDNIEDHGLCIDDDDDVIKEYYNQNNLKSTFKIKTREQFIKYLSDLPNKVNDNKIRRVLTIKEH